MKLLAWCTLLLLLTNSQLWADNSAQPIRMAAPHITSLIEEDKSGIYQRIMKEALQRMNQQSKQYYSPYKRALLSFQKKQVDCIYSFTKVMQEKLGKENILYSFPLGAFAYYIFTNKHKAEITDPQKLEPLKVGAVYGHENYYKHQLTDNTKLIMANKDTQNIKMLSLNRLDALIGALPDLMPYLPELNFSPVHPLVESYDRITCHKTPENQSFLNKLSNTLETMKNEGLYKEISKDLFFNFDNEKAKQ